MVQALWEGVREKYPGATPRIISENGPQFIANEFKSFIRICPRHDPRAYVPVLPTKQREAGAISPDVEERVHSSTDTSCDAAPLSLEDGQRIVSKFVEEYNEVRLHSEIGYVTPRDMLEGRQAAIHAERDRKVAEARERRAAVRAEQATARRNGAAASYADSSRPEDRALLGSNPSAESMPMTEAPVGSS